jgi:hypothetical protein
MGAAVLHWIRSDLGITLNGSNVSAWADQSGAGNHYTQGTGAAQPAYTASDATLNNQPSVLFDGSDDFMASSFDPPTPGAGVVTYVWLIAKSITWTSNDVIYGTQAVGNCTVFQGGASPQYAMFGSGGANVNGACTLGNWARIGAAFSSSTSDVIRVISTNVTGGNAGAQNSSSSEIGHGADLLGFCNFRLAELFVANRAPTGPEATALDAYVTSRYGAGLV